MNLERTLWGINEEVKAMVDSQFTVNVGVKSKVPEIDSSDLTFPDFKNDKLSTVEIETCVLFIDIRKSTDISQSHRRTTLAKLYSAFVRAMVQAAEYYGGKVRNIIGDRVMVVFDNDKCYTNSVNTAILLHSVSEYIINKHFKHNEIKCGIGIDYGKLLVVKTGAIKRSSESREYKSLVWLGNACNHASKLTDVANKEIDIRKYQVEYEQINYSSLFSPPLGDFLNAFGHIKQPSSNIIKKVVSEEAFLKGIGDSKTGISFTQSAGDIKSFKKIEEKVIIKPILISEEVYKGYKKESPEDESIKSNWWKLQDLKSQNISNKTYGASIHFKVVNKI